MFKTLGFAVVACVGAASASASTLTQFNLNGSGGLAPSYSFSEDGIGLTITAGTFNSGGVSEGTALVGQYSRGLGVTSHYGDQHFVDGATKNDVLILNFDRDIRFHSAVFAYNESGDDFRFFFENSGGGSLDDWGSNIDIPGTSFYATYVFNGTWIGDYFGIGAKGYRDEFKLRALVVERLAAVPLPPAIVLMLSAFGLLGWFGLRGKSTGEATAV